MRKGGPFGPPSSIQLLAGSKSLFFDPQAESVLGDLGKRRAQLARVHAECPCRIPCAGRQQRYCRWVRNVHGYRVKFNATVSDRRAPAQHPAIQRRAIWRTRADAIRCLGATPIAREVDRLLVLTIGDENHHLA
jgi:hypothetical protein